MTEKKGLIGWWNDLHRRMAPTAGSTIASGGTGPRPERLYVFLPAGTDYKKLALSLIEQCGYEVITGDKKRGGQSGSRKRRNSSRLPGGVKLPTGITLREHVRIVKEAAEENENRKLSNAAALRRILEWTVGAALKAQGAPESRIKMAIDKEFPSFKTRYQEARRPRKRVR